VGTSVRTVLSSANVLNLHRRAPVRGILAVRFSGSGPSLETRTRIVGRMRRVNPRGDSGREAGKPAAGSAKLIAPRLFDYNNRPLECQTSAPSILATGQ